MEGQCSCDRAKASTGLSFSCKVVKPGGIKGRGGSASSSFMPGDLQAVTRTDKISDLQNFQLTLPKMPLNFLSQTKKPATQFKSAPMTVVHFLAEGNKFSCTISVLIWKKKSILPASTMFAQVQEIRVRLPVASRATLHQRTSVTEWSLFLQSYETQDNWFVFSNNFQFFNFPISFNISNKQ